MQNARSTPAPTSTTITLVTQPAGPAPRASRRVEWIHLAEEGDYAEHQIKARIRYPDTFNTEFSSGDFARIRKALRVLVLAHNGWIDPDSEDDDPKVLPPAPGEGSDGFWDSLAQEELLLMLRAIGAERKKSSAHCSRRGATPRLAEAKQCRDEYSGTRCALAVHPPPPRQGLGHSAVARRRGTRGRSGARTPVPRFGGRGADAVVSALSGTRRLARCLC